MKVYFAIWIFISALFLQQFCSSADSNVTDSALLNLILENSTFMNFEKELKTDKHNTSDLFFSYTTTSLPISSRNDDCESGNCDKKVNFSSSTNNSSTSKVQWNLVNMSKSTTMHDLSNDESSTEEQVLSSVAHIIHSSVNHSNIYNSSLHSSDNELDSDIKFENIDYILYGEDVSNKPYLDYNLTSFESMPITTEISHNIFNLSNENSTYDSEAVVSLETIPYTLISDSTNTTALDSSEVTSAQTDSEIDFTTYFSTMNSNLTTLNNEENKTETYDYVSDVPFGSTNTDLESKEINAEDNDIQADRMINNFPETSSLYSTSVEDTSSKDVNSTCADCYDSESYTPSSYNDHKYNTPSTVNTEISTENTLKINTEHHDSVSVRTEFATLGSVPVHYDYDDNNSSDDSYLNNSSEPMTYTSGSSEVANTASNIHTDMHVNSMYPSSVEAASTDNNLETVKDNIFTTAYFTTVMLPVTTESVIDSHLGSNNFSGDNLATISTENKLHVSKTEASESVQNTSNTELPLNVVSLDVEELTEVTDAYPENSSEMHTSTTISDTSTTILSGSRSYRIDDFTGYPQGRSNPITSHDDVPSSEIATQYVSSTVTSVEADVNETNSSFIPYGENLPVTSNVDPNVNEVLSSSIAITSTEPAYLNNLNEISKHMTSSHKVTTVTTILDHEEKSTTVSTNTENSSETILNMSSNKILTSTEKEVSSDLLTDHTVKHLNTHEYTTSEIDNKETKTTTVSSILYSVNKEITSNDDAIHDLSDSKPTTGYYITETSPIKTDSTSTTIAYPIETNDALESSQVLDATNEEQKIDTISTTPEITSFTEISSSDYSETHRAGKHIPFSSTLVKSTTAFPTIYNITVGTFPRHTAPETTERNLIHLLYNQIRPEDLSPEERSNLVNAVIKIPDKVYSEEELNKKIAIIHLWLLHAIADEYKNASFNLSRANENQLHDVEFENLPEILYVLPTPDIFLPNISLTFIVHNKWRNATFPAEIIAAILNLHTEDLKRVVEIEEIHFSHGLLVQKADLFSVIIEKYGIILLATCLITVGMILLLICVVIYYRRKTRHSAHCLTDDKLHRNMQEAMGIDLNPAVIILQDEIREKAALNGNKISSLDDDEGWLAPIGDVPVAEDNNAPFVQDTKL